MTCPHGDPLCPCPDGLLCHYEGDHPAPCPRTSAVGCTICQEPTMTVTQVTVGLRLDNGVIVTGLDRNSYETSPRTVGMRISGVDPDGNVWLGRWTGDHWQTI